MRQFLLVIVLVAAAFGGGALVSGPGFRWAQEHLLDYMGLKDGGEIDSLDLTPAPGAAQPAKAAPSEPLVGPAAVAKADAPRAAEPPLAEPSPAPPPLPTPEPRSTEPFTETQAAATSPAPAKAEPPALLGALSSILSPPAAPTPAASGPAGSTRPASEPAPPPPPAMLDPGVAPSALPAPPAGSAVGDWAEVRRKLAAVGVTRYTIEADPNGRVLFACLIPLAGKQAVSQRFEAEGGDEFQAAQAVLKRINLWRATQAGTPGSR